MNANTTPLPTESAPSSERTTKRHRFFHRHDNPPGIDTHALPSEMALRPIEPVHTMHR